MRQLMKHKVPIVLSVMLSAVLLFVVAGHLQSVSADSTVSPVTLVGIDYSKMELTLQPNGNVIVYYSTDKKTWHEMEPTTDTSRETPTLLCDISWISAASTTTLYFRGNEDTTTLAVKIPGYNKSFKVKFDKAAGSFEFLNTEDAEIIRWRKQTDYDWSYVWIDESKPTGSQDGYEVQSVADFEKEISNLRVKGTKLIFQIAPKPWTSESNPGSRPSKDVKVSVTAKKAAPSMKVNLKKLTVNTKTKYEWTTTNPTTTAAVTWENCTAANMSLNDLASAAMQGTGEVTLYFRTEATSSNSESKVAALTIPARESAPTSPIVLAQTPGAAAGKGKATVTFSNVPSEGYEYTVVKSGTLTDESKVSWKKIKSAKTVKFTEKTLPAGATIYVRTAGVAMNAKKGIDLKLPSKYMSQTVPAYTAATTPSTS